MGLWGYIFLAVLIIAIVQLKKHFFPAPLYWIWDDGFDDTVLKETGQKRQVIDTDDVHFPKNFLWGTATAAYQIEGNINNTNWSEWEKQTDKKGNPRIARGEKNGAACDHWNRVEEDVKLMKDLGMNAYRFSVEWARLQPNGPDSWDEAAVKHYSDEIDALKKNGIEPLLTLHHFTNPIWFEQLGAFEKKENINHFVRYSERVFLSYADRVSMWATINEMEVYTNGGWFIGVFPPGKERSPVTGEVLRNILDAHVRVYHSLKKMPRGSQCRIGFVKNLYQLDPWNSWNPLDVFVSRKASGVFNEGLLNFFATGKFKFDLPVPGMKKVEWDCPDAVTSYDFCGLNYYSHSYVQFRPSLTEPIVTRHNPHAIMTDMTYPIYAEGFYRAIMDMSKLKKPIIITENGLADKHDDRRQLFIRRYLYALSKAIKDGADVQGYFYWSLMDNFEWCLGYDMRFGLYHTDYATQKRTLRAGSQHLINVIRRHKQEHGITA